MSKENVLVVEDDKHISKLVKYNLEKAGSICKVADVLKIDLKGKPAK
jgi:DNA-binding response OmpR family regulator